MSTTKKLMHAGVNESNREVYICDESTSPADDASWTIDFSDVLRDGTTGLPVVRAVGSYGAGAAGARTFTYMPVINVGSALVGVEVVSFDEATGVLTLTNRSGGALTTPRVVVELFPDVQ